MGQTAIVQSGGQRQRRHVAENASVRQSARRPARESICPLDSKPTRRPYIVYPEGTSTPRLTRTEQAGVTEARVPQPDPAGRTIEGNSIRVCRVGCICRWNRIRYYDRLTPESVPEFLRNACAPAPAQDSQSPTHTRVVTDTTPARAQGGLVGFASCPRSGPCSCFVARAQGIWTMRTAANSRATVRVDKEEELIERRRKLRADIARQVVEAAIVAEEECKSVRISEPHFIPTHVSTTGSNATRTPSVSIRSPGFPVGRQPPQLLEPTPQLVPLLRDQLPCPRTGRVLRPSKLVEACLLLLSFNDAYGEPR